MLDESIRIMIMAYNRHRARGYSAGVRTWCGAEEFDMVKAVIGMTSELGFDRWQYVHTTGLITCCYGSQPVHLDITQCSRGEHRSAWLWIELGGGQTYIATFTWHHRTVLGRTQWEVEASPFEMGWVIGKEVDVPF